MEKIENGFEYVIASPKTRFIDWKELWQFRELFYFFSWRDIKVKYKQTALGVLWVLLQPIITVAVFSLFFGRALNVPSAGLAYPVFVFSGLLLWNVFSTSVNTGGNSMLTNAAIIKKIYFPRVIIPVSAIIGALVDFIVSFALFLAVLLYYHIDINYFKLFLYWPLAIFIMLLGTIGISCWLAALTVKYRDIRYVIPFGLQIALFVSPVIYPTSILGDGWIKYLLAINPLYGAIVLFRHPLIDLPIDSLSIIISVTSSFVFFVWGAFYFKNTEAYFADIA